MKRVFWTILALGVCASFAYTSITARNERLARARTAIAETKSIQDDLFSMVQRHAAEGDAVEIGPVITIDLMDLRLLHKSIAFRGTISDIETYNIQNYTVTVDSDPVATVIFTGTEVRLELSADRQLMDVFLDHWSQIKGKDTMRNGVIIIAKIFSIQSGEVLIGEGQLEDIIYTGLIPL